MNFVGTETQLSYVLRRSRDTLILLIIRRRTPEADLLTQVLASTTENQTHLPGEVHDLGRVLANN